MNERDESGVWMPGIGRIWRQYGVAGLAACQFVAHDDASLHHELDAFHLSDVGERVSGYGDDVGELAFLDAADLLS